MTALTKLTPLLRTRITAVWAALVAATAVSWYFGTDHGINNHDVTSALVVIVAFIKVRLVGLYFMELRNAPIVLRAVFESYCLVVCALILGLYFDVFGLAGK